MRSAGRWRLPRRTTPSLVSGRLVALALTATVAATACGGDDETASTTTTAATAPTTAAPTTAAPTTAAPTTTTPGRDDDRALARSCTHEDRDVRIAVRYPEGWHVNDPQRVQPCSAFDPEPVDIQPASEYPRDLAVVVRVEPFPFEESTAPTGLQMESEQQATLDGRRALRQVVVSTGDGLTPPGLRSLRYVIDGGTDRSVIATTYDVEGNDFPESSDVLDAMAGAFDIEPRP